MKIVQLIQKPQLRGAEMFASQLATHLEKNGHTCLLVSIFAGDGELPFAGKHIRLGRSLRHRLWDWAAWKTFARMLKEEQVDLVQANAGDTLKFAVLSKLFFGWKTPIVFRNANKISDFINTPSKHRFNAFFVRRVSYVISVSDLCRQDFMNTFSFPSDKISTGTIGVETDAVGDLPADLAPLFAQGDVLVNVGGLVPEKNHQGLLRIFSKVAAQRPDVHLAIVGVGRLMPVLTEQVAQLGLTGRVHFLGRRTDVLRVVKAAAAFVMPSHIEGLPAVILEAMYCKTPVVANDVGGISEVVVPAQTGWLIRKDDEASFADAVLEILNDRAKARTVADKAYEQVTDRYTNARVTAQFLSAYSKVLGKNVGSGKR